MFFPNQQRPYNQQLMSDDFWFPSRHQQPIPRGNNLTNMVQKILRPNSNVTNVTTRGVEGISRTLNGVQQVLRVVDTAAPIVKQYGPIVRNIPAMYRMMKAFKNMESTDEELLESDESGSGHSLESTSLDEYESSIKSSPRRKGESTPKLFI